MAKNVRGKKGKRGSYVGSKFGQDDKTLITKDPLHEARLKEREEFLEGSPLSHAYGSGGEGQQRGGFFGLLEDVTAGIGDIHESTINLAETGEFETDRKRVRDEQRDADAKQAEIDKIEKDISDRKKKEEAKEKRAKSRSDKRAEQRRRYRSGQGKGGTLLTNGLGGNGGGGRTLLGQ